MSPVSLVCRKQRQKLECLRIRADRRDNLLKILLSIAEAHDEDHPYITVSEILKRTGIRSTTVRRLVNRLVEKKFVTRQKLFLENHEKSVDP